MKNSMNQKIDDIFKQVGEFGAYQLILFCLVGITAFIPAIVGYSYSFYGAVPDYRCKIPGLENDTYESMGVWHDSLVQKYIPESKENFKTSLDKCQFRNFNNNLTSTENFTVLKCNQWVYSKKYFQSTLNSEWNLVCDQSPRRSLFSTLYFIGTYGVLLNGILSDKFGRKKGAYGFIVANALINCALALLINTNYFETNTQQILFAVLRFFCGIASNVYAVAVVLAIEICGASKRVMAANFIYYFYILGEFLVVFFAYFIKNYRHLYATYAFIMTLFVFYFWVVPESPRWLMAKNKTKEAHKIFKKIAKWNKKSFDDLNELEILQNYEKTPKTYENESNESNNAETQNSPVG